MRRLLILILAALMCFTCIGETAIWARSPTVKVIVRRPYPDDDFGRGGTVTESKIVYADVGHFELNENEEQIYVPFFADNEDPITQFGMIYQRLFDDETERETIQLNYLQNIPANEVEGCEVYYYQLVDYTIRLRVYDADWSSKSDDDGVTVWTINVKPAEETEDMGIYSREDGYEYCTQFFWEGIMGVDEDTDIDIIEGDTYAFSPDYGPNQINTIKAVKIGKTMFNVIFKENYRYDEDGLCYVSMDRAMSWLKCNGR